LPAAGVCAFAWQLTTGRTSQASPASVALANQFESDGFDIVRPTELGVPSTLLP